MTDLTLPSPRQTAGRAGAARRARTRLSTDGVIAAYVREMATHQAPRERERPQPRVRTGRGTARGCRR